MIEKFEKEHNGVIYKHMRSDKEVAAVASLGDKRVVLKGKPNFIITKGSYKFPRELQLNLCALKGENIPTFRNDSKWDIIEIDMPLEVGKELITAINKELEKEVKK